MSLAPRLRDDKTTRRPFWSQGQRWLAAMVAGRTAIPGQSSRDPLEQARIRVMRRDIKFARQKPRQQRITPLLEVSGFGYRRPQLINHRRIRLGENLGQS